MLSSSRNFFFKPKKVKLWSLKSLDFDKVLCFLDMSVHSFLVAVTEEDSEVSSSRLILL